MQPADQMSMEVLYSLAPKRTSGGRYLQKGGWIAIYIGKTHGKPKCDHFGTVATDGNAKGPGQAKIGQLQLGHFLDGIVDQQILPHCLHSPRTY